jgi:hypothetical protein
MNDQPTNRHVISAPIFRSRARHVRFTNEPPDAPAVAESVRRPAKVAQLVALAHHIQRAIDRGEVLDRATVARSLGITRARVSQLLDLTLLAPDIALALLELEAVDGAEPMAERELREVVRAGSWEAQRGMWSGLKWGRGSR